MNQEKTFDALNAIADEIEVAERPWVQAWARINAPAEQTAGVSGAQLFEDLKNAELALAEFISGKARQIAEITGNSESNIRMGFGPRKEGRDTWFDTYPSHPASWFLRQVAKYRSFNTNYWAEEERRIERDAFMAKMDVHAKIVSVDEAARIMKEGGVPCVAGDDFVRGRPLMKFEKEAQALSRLERAMVRAGLLAQYDKSWADRVSTTQSVAFVLKNEHGEADGVYWTKGVARQRSENITFEPVVAESVMDAPRG